MDSPVLCTAIVVQRPGPAGRPEVLLLKRVAPLVAMGYDPFAGHWELPGAELMESEGAEAWARVGLLLDTGLVATSSGVLEPFTFAESFRGRVRRVLLAYRVVSWSGEPEVRRSDQHSEIGWFDPAEPPRRLMPGVGAVLRRLAAQSNGPSAASGPLAGLAGHAGLAASVPEVPTFTDPVGDF